MALILALLASLSGDASSDVTPSGMNGIMIPIIWIGDIDDDEEE